MEEKVKLFCSEFKTLNVEPKEYLIKNNSGYEEGKIYYQVTGLNGNKNLQLFFEDEAGLERLTSLLRNNLFVFNDFLGIKYENTIEILLMPISFRSLMRNIEYGDDENYKVIDIHLNYYKNELDISLEVGETNKVLPKFTEFIRGGYRYRRRPTVLKIDNYLKPTADGIENDTRNIVNSVLFDIEYNYEIALETINIESLRRRAFKSRRKQNELPKERISLIYKKYIPELIQYFHIAEKVDYIPFKYICYYHIIEYFSDKSAYFKVAEEIKIMMLKPDFHIKTDEYVINAINLFKKESDKNTGDKIKIERVLRQYINREDLKEAFIDKDLFDNFSKEIVFDCNKPLKLPAINFDQDGNFYGDLTKRIYSVRCSIVHSNPEFDESKAVPFKPTPNNIELLRTESELIMEIARIIIVETKK